LLDPRRAVGRTAIAFTVALVAGQLLSLQFRPLIAVLGGWNAGGIAMLALTWERVARYDAARTRARAGAEDPGRGAVYVIVALTSFVSLFAGTYLSRVAKTLSDPGERTVVLALCLLTVALSWVLTHTIMTLRYARLYYRADEEGVGGVTFPGNAPPSYFDFAYFAFTVGMCFQVSDACVSSPRIRRTVLLHAILSFVYNTVIVAFALNLVFGAFG
jgi:uncharacterized membrane protein